jgi:hypothetical protein
MRTDSQSNGLAEQGRALLRRAVVAVVQAADQWHGDDAAERWCRDRPGVVRKNSNLLIFRSFLRIIEGRPAVAPSQYDPSRDARTCFHSGPSYPSSRS